MNKDKIRIHKTFLAFYNFYVSMTDKIILFLIYTKVNIFYIYSQDSFQFTETLISYYKRRAHVLINVLKLMDTLKGVFERT